MIDTEVRRLLDEARTRVSESLATHRQTMDLLANELLKNEVVDRMMLDALLRPERTTPAPEPDEKAAA